MDFTFIAQYPVHTGETVEFMEDALLQYHENLSIFCDLGLRRHFNLPKLHFASHYGDLVKLFGTTDNFNTENTERLHIDIAKDAYEATNHKDEFSQMTVWQEWKEKIHKHDGVIKWRQEGSPPITAPPEPGKMVPSGLELDRKLRMSKHPSNQAISLETIETEYGAEHFCTALRRYVILSNSPQLMAAQVERGLWDTHLPFRRLPVWHRVKFSCPELYTGVTQIVDSIHAYPRRLDVHGRPIPARFDTAFINDGTGGDTGIVGKFVLLQMSRDY